MSIAAQLQAIKSQLRGAGPEPLRRPLTRPSVLFDPKEAADIDSRTILPIAISGLEVLIGLDSRFERYKETLFSNASLDVDRDKLVPKEEEKLNKSVTSYLRLLAGHLQLPAALKTLEYLIRRYRVYAFNPEELILCALPYHDTHVFVRIVQLIDLGSNKKWAFLEGIKSSGAPPPRKVIVQQCLRDKGVLEAICNYASPTKDFAHSRAVICFSTAVAVEALGSIQRLDDDTVQRVLPFVLSGLDPSLKGGRDDKAGALMVVGLLASRSTLAVKLTNSLIYAIARMARQDAKESEDLPWLRTVLMSIISLIQSHSFQVFPEKSLKVLAEIRDLAGVLAGLSQDFNIEKFLSVYLETLSDNSCSDEACCVTLIAALDVIPMRNSVTNIVAKLLRSCLKLSKNVGDDSMQEAGARAKRLLHVVDKNYQPEFRLAMRNFLENSKKYSMEEDAMFKALCLILGSSLEPLDTATEISDSHIWLSLEHPKASVRRDTLRSLSSSGVLNLKSLHPQMLANVQDALLRHLHDDDLAVVQAVLSINGLFELVKPLDLLVASQDVLDKCVNILKTSASDFTSEAREVAIACLDSTCSNYVDNIDYSNELAKIVFPLLLISQKTFKVNLKALEWAKRINWPLFSYSSLSCDFPSLDSEMKLEASNITCLNLKIVRALAKGFVKNFEEVLACVNELGRNNLHSKTLLLYIILQSVLEYDGDANGLLKIFGVCYPFITEEWRTVDHTGNAIFKEDIYLLAEKLDSADNVIMYELLGPTTQTLSVKSIIYIFWEFLKGLALRFHGDLQSMEVENSSYFSAVRDIVTFFSSSSLKNIFRKHSVSLVEKSTSSPVAFLSKFFTEGFPVEVQLETLYCYANLGTVVASANQMNTKYVSELLIGFPSLLVPLSSKIKELRIAAMNCIDGLYNVWCGFDISRLKNGSDTNLFSVSAPTFGKLLNLINQQKKLIISDSDFLPSLMSSVLLPSSEMLLVPKTVDKRFDQREKDALLYMILSSVFKLSPLAKLAVLQLLKGIGNVLFKIDQVKLLLDQLMRRRQCIDKRTKKLSETDIDTLCQLLEVSTIVTDPDTDMDVISNFAKALKVNPSPEEPALIKPCLTALQNLSSVFYDSLPHEIQDDIFSNLVFLLHNDEISIRSATREAVLRITIGYSTVARFIEMVVQKVCKNWLPKKKKSENPYLGNLVDGESVLSFLRSLLDITLLKKDIKRRDLMVGTLFNLLKELISVDWMEKIVNFGDEGSECLSEKNMEEISQEKADAIVYAQQTTIIILEDICATFGASLKDGLQEKVDINFLIDFARSTNNAITRNHVLMLLAALARISSEWVSDHILNLFTVIGESAIKQNDNHSQRVVEDLISTLVPCWLAETDGTKNLLQVFVDCLPQVTHQRRLTLMLYLLRTLGEKANLGTLLCSLFRSAIQRGKFMESHANVDVIRHEWEYLFAAQLCSQMTCSTWLSSLVSLLDEVQVDTHEREFCFVLFAVMRFILDKLTDTGLAFELESGEDATNLQSLLGALMERIILKMQVIYAKRLKACTPRSLKALLKELERTLMKAISTIMTPSEYFKCMTRLFGNSNNVVVKKSLGYLSGYVKNGNVGLKNQKNRRNVKQSKGSSFLFTNEASFEDICFKMITLVNGPESSLKLDAISCLEAFAEGSFLNDNILMASLKAIVNEINASNSTISCGPICCTGTLIRAVRSKALPELPIIMDKLLKCGRNASSCSKDESKKSRRKSISTISKIEPEISFHILSTLEAVIDNLGCFLNPYLEDILELLMLHPVYISETDPKINTKAASVRKLTVEKIPVRLILPPLLKVYPATLKGGEASLSISFGMLAHAIQTMDRPSIGSYYVKIFDHCLLALNLRQLCPESIKNINTVEQSIISALVTLTMKLTESMFRPLFLQSLDWAESDLESNDSKARSIERMISFYTLVNTLVEQQRSLFVPYFKYLTNGIVRSLTDDPDTILDLLPKKRKKTKPSDSSRDRGRLSFNQWRLRALIVASLYKCFLYDTGSLKFLDSSNFQLLLKPIVSQLTVEPPESFEDATDLPTPDNFDEDLVNCLGQMAVATGSDDMWKQLNHEVLMQTRSEKTHPRILGLKVVKYLLDHLKEEYLVLLPETIPFLGELLEDMDLSVKSLSQDIFRELETLSGENLQQYL